MDMDDDDMQVSAIHTTYKMTHIATGHIAFIFIYSNKKIIRH